MSFETSEIATGSKPVEFFLFQGPDTAWRYTSSGTNLTIGGNTYVATAIGRQKIELNSEATKQNLTIECGRDLPMLAAFSGVPVTVTVFRAYGADLAVIWKGRVITKSFAGETASINCESVFTSMKRPGLRRKYQILCPHVLYGEGCNVNRGLYEQACVVVSATGLTVTVDTVGGKADQWFKAGYLQFGSHYRTINSQVGVVLTMDRPLALVATNALTIYPGCKHDIGDCTDKFDNLLNFGGWPWIPTINPFSDLGGRL